MNPAILWTAVGMMFYIVAEYYSKRYAMASSWRFYWLAILPYWVVTLCWMPVIRHTNTLAVTSVIWDIFYFIISILIGVLIFQEKMSATQVVGLVLGAIAVVLLSVE